MALWKQRNKGAIWDTDDLYDVGSGWFTIKLHHGGEFACIGNMKYVGGFIDYFDYCHGDLMAATEIDTMVKGLGYTGNMFFTYKEPTIDLESGLRVVEIRDISELGKTHKCIEVYVEHGLSNCGLFCEPVISSQELIDELNDISSQLDTFAHRKETTMTSLLFDITDEQIEQCAAIFESQTKANTVTEKKQVENIGLDEVNNEVDDESENSDDPDYNACLDHDYEMSDDDRDDAEFKEHIDEDVEWCGVTKRKGRKYDQSILGDTEMDGNDSEYGNSEDLWSIGSDDDVDGCQSRKNGEDFIARTQMRNPDYKLNLRFANAQEVKLALKEYSIKNRRVIKIVKNDKTRVRAKCIGHANCPWLVHVSPKQNESTWEVKTFIDQHICMKSREIKSLTPEWIARTYISRFRTQPNWTPASIVLTVHEDHKIDISTDQAYRAKRLAEEMNHGNHTEQYGLLWDYCHEVRRTNPGSTMKVKLDPLIDINKPNERKFLRIYCCLGPLKAGFAAGCRNVLGMDGCFLKGPFTGQILTSIGIDANNGMYPLAYAIVEAENRECWEWFLELLIDDVGFNNNEHWVIITDQQKGLDGALNALLPHVEHRYCLLHMYNNYKKQFRGKEYKDKLYNMAFATTIPHFTRAMEGLREKSEDAFKWVCERNPPQWSRAHFSEAIKSDILMNNISESFNAHILAARDKPIITMLEKIRNYLMTRIHRKLAEIEKCGVDVLPRIQRNINLSKIDAQDFIADYNGASKYQCRGPWGAQFVVDLKERTCSCRKWQLSGVPCSHAIAAIWCEGKSGGNGQPELWVDDCYKLETQRRIYEHTINPINGVDMWEKVEGLNKIVCPKNKIQPGRPRKARKKDKDEVKKSKKGDPPPTKATRKGGVITCMRCGATGHNSHQCKNQGCQSYAATKIGRGRGARGQGNVSEILTEIADKEGQDTGRGIKRGTGSARGINTKGGVRAKVLKSVSQPVAGSAGLWGTPMYSQPQECQPQSSQHQSSQPLKRRKTSKILNI